MKRYFVLFLLIFCAFLAFAQNITGLDGSIQNTAIFLSERIPAGTTVAVFNFSSDSEKLSEYIVNELTFALANNGMNVFDRNNLDEVNREIYHGFTGAVNDDSAQSYGHDVGVQTVILGSLTKTGDKVYSLRVQAIVVETKRIQAARTTDVKEDTRILSFFNKNFTNLTSAGFKNMLFGWGSFSMRDPFGGISTTVLEVASIAAIVYGLGNLYIAIDVTNGNVLHNSFPVDSGIWVDPVTGLSYEYDNDAYTKAWEKFYNDFTREASIVLFSGLGGLALTWTWGFIRPHMYASSLTARKIASVIDNLHIGVLPMSNGRAGVNVSLNYRF